MFTPGSAHALGTQTRSEATLLRMAGEIVDRKLPDPLKIGDNAPAGPEPVTDHKE